MITGLTNDEVLERVRAGQTNASELKTSKSVGEIVRDNVFTYFNLIFLIVAVLLIIVGSYRDLTFLPIIIINILIQIFQELRAKRVLDKLRVLNSPQATVIREGKEKSVAVEELVIDDVILLRAGDQIPADAKVVEGEMAVNESLLTGEADEIMKRRGAELLSGSFVVFGSGVAKLTKVGKDSYAAKLTLRAKAIKTQEQSEIIRSLNKYLKIVGIIIVPLGTILFIQQYLVRGESMETAVVAMVAAILGMIPEGLFLLSSVRLALSAMNLARNEVMLHEMKSIETLARVDTLLVDKTGTITSEKMKVVEVTGEKETLALMATAMSEENNETMKAIRKEVRGEKVSLPKSFRVVPFSSKYKFSGVQISPRKALVLGAPEMVLREKYEEYRAEIEKKTRRGYRVLVFGEYPGELSGETGLLLDVKVAGMVVVENEIRKTAKKTFSYFAEQGVEVKVISGDNPATVSEVAKKAGIPGAEKMVDASKLSSDEELSEAVMTKVVLGRVSPEQKRKIVNILKSAGRTVAMTGDGVNDVLALKDADCSVAMASGAQAAISAAQIVLLSSDFSKMPEVVLEGRRVVNNIERSGSLFIVKNLFSFLMAVMAFLFAFSYPMLPAQVAMVTLFSIGMPSVLLALEPSKKLISGNFLFNIVKTAIPAALTGVVIMVVVVILGGNLGISREELAMVSTVVWGVVGMVHLFRVCLPFTKWSFSVFLISLIGLPICIWQFGWMFRANTAISETGGKVAVMASLITIPVMFAFVWVTGKIGGKVARKYGIIKGSGA
ncbi:HAD-IC family P-type ATPase [Candidatus Saccharibacteria bacterium]|nr:HAD-IC family P-type ATPase [Candidatus Saccharibacteria bacterium]